MIDNKKEVPSHHFEVIGNSFIIHPQTSSIRSTSQTYVQKSQIKMTIIVRCLGWDDMKNRSLFLTEAALDLLRPHKTYCPCGSLSLRNFRCLQYGCTKLIGIYHLLPPTLQFFLISQTQKDIGCQQRESKWKWFLKHNITLRSNPLNACFYLVFHLQRNNVKVSRGVSCNCDSYREKVMYVLNSNIITS